MPAVEGFRSPYDKTAGGLHHLGRMIDKIRLKHAGKLPEDYHRNYGLAVGLDGMMCGFLNVKFEAIETRVIEGGSDTEIVAWIFTQGYTPNRQQTAVWNEYSRKLGLSDRLGSFLAKMKEAAGLTDRPDLATTFDLIDFTEDRPPPKTS